jgi:formiminoglutamase
VPPELTDRIRIGPEDILADGDAFTGEIYDVSDCVNFQIRAEVARAFVDLNRAEDDLPPENPDGVVKSRTVFDKPVYFEGRQPDSALIERLLKRYHRPYHRRIREVLADYRPGVELALDCHSMLAVGPNISPDPGRTRPALCLGNQNGRSCPPETLDILAECFRRVFGLGESDVALNRPFSGGYITRTYGGNPVPWIQIELSRGLYMQGSTDVASERLIELNTMFREVLNRFFGR